jgi:hypothetical protein
MERDTNESLVLLDVTSGGGAFEQDLVERLGHPVRVCHGPGDGVCPLLAGKGCPDFEAAHGVIFELDLDRPQHRDVLRRYRDLAREDVPVRAVVRPDQAERYADMLGDIEVMTHEPNVAELDGFAAEVEAGDRA